MLQHIYHKTRQYTTVEQLCRTVKYKIVRDFNVKLNSVLR